jgi:hypothetical protein
MKEYFRVVSVEADWEKILDKYRIDWVIFDANSLLSRFLLANSGWRLIYGDKVANIFVRNSAENRALIDRYRDVRPVPQKKSTEN